MPVSNYHQGSIITRGQLSPLCCCACTSGGQEGGLPTVLLLYMTTKGKESAHEGAGRAGVSGGRWSTVCCTGGSIGREGLPLTSVATTVSLLYCVHMYGASIAVHHRITVDPAAGMPRLRSPLRTLPWL